MMTTTMMTTTMTTIGIPQEVVKQVQGMGEAERRTEMQRCGVAILKMVALGVEVGKTIAQGAEGVDASMAIAPGTAVRPYAAAVPDSVTLSVMTRSYLKKRNIIERSFPDNERKCKPSHA